MNSKSTRIRGTLRRLALVCVIVVGVLSILATDGGGEGGGVTFVPSGGPTLANLEGTWFGTLEERSGALHTISVTIDGSGNLSQELIDNDDTHRTGTISQTSGSIFSFVLSDGTVGALIADARVTHAGFLDQFFNSGIVQKNTSSLPTYASTDIVGSWSGLGLALDSAFNVVQTANSRAAVKSDLNFTETNSSTGTTTGIFTTFDSHFGLAAGTYANPGSTGVAEAFLSPDKSFAAVWNCDTTDEPDVFVGFPDDCFFFAYRFVAASSGTIVIDPGLATFAVGTGAGCDGSIRQIASYVISTFDDLGQPLGNADINIILDHAANTTPGGPVLTVLVDGDSLDTVSNIADPVPYSTTTDALGNKTMLVIYETSPGCTYKGNMTVGGAGLLTTEMNFTVEE